MTSEVRRRARRKFLCGAATLASWTMIETSQTAFPTARAEEAARTIGLGFSLYGMKSLELSAALKALAEIGYDCVELPVMPDWPADSAKISAEARRALRGQLTERGLRLTSLMENLPSFGDDAQHRANLDRLQRAAELAHDLAPAKSEAGKLAAPLIETILGGKPGEFDAGKERLVQRMKDWEQVAAAAQVVVAVKAHVGNAIQRPEQLIWLLEQLSSPWLQGAYDYSHFQLQDLALQETMHSLLPKCVFVHVKDTEHAQGKRGFLLPGEGSIAYLQMFKLLGQSNYRGDVVVEVSSQVFNRPGYDPLAAASKCYNHLADAISKSGLRRG